MQLRNQKSLSVTRLGYTLIEIMLAISLSAVLVTLGTNAYLKSAKRQAVKSGTDTLLATLSTAQKKANTGEKDCSGVLLGYETIITGDSSQVVTTPKCSAGSGTATTTVISHIYFKSSTTLLFKPLNGGVTVTGNNPANIDFIDSGEKSVASPSATYRVKVESTGSISYLGEL